MKTVRKRDASAHSCRLITNPIRRWGWLFMLGERIRILSPKFLIERYDYLLKSLRDYNELSL